MSDSYDFKNKSLAVYPQMKEEFVDDLAVNPGAMAVRDSFTSAIDSLRAQRGLSTRERIGALLIGFGQPTSRRGGWKESVANASQMMLSQAMASRRDDRERDNLIAKYKSEIGPKSLEAAADWARANKPEELVKDGQQRMRLGYARRLFPGKTDKELVEANLLYDPRVDKQIIRIYGAQGAARIGEEVEESEITETAAPEVGVIQDGYRYKGGDPANPSSWIKVTP